MPGAVAAESAGGHGSQAVQPRRCPRVMGSPHMEPRRQQRPDGAGLTAWACFWNIQACAHWGRWCSPRKQSFGEVFAPALPQDCFVLSYKPLPFSLCQARCHF